MSDKAWKMDEETKIKVGKYILETIKTDGSFPETPEEGKKKFEEIGVVFEGSVTGVLFHENDANGLMHVAIPPRDAVKYNYENPESYKIPDTYVNISTGKSSLSPDQVYQFRIGDYTISHCG